MRYSSDLLASMTTKALLVASVFFISVACLADNTQTTNPTGTQATTVKISADHAVFSRLGDSGANTSSARAVYTGNARFHQGQRVLSASKIELVIEAQQITRVIASGTTQQPVHLTEGDTLNAQAEHLEYIAASDSLHLTGQARIEHNGRIFEGATIDYQLTEEQVEASGDKSQRVKLVLPGELAPTPDTQSDTKQQTAPSTEQESGQ